MRRLLIRKSGTLYRVFGFEFKDHADGSLYIHIRSVREKEIKISYHATGRINYRGSVEYNLYSEPIFSISKPHLLCTISLAQAEELSIAPSARSDDFILDMNGNENGRVNLYVSITPPSYSYAEWETAYITYADWFALHVSGGPTPDSAMDADESRIFVPRGQFQSQLVSQEQALIFFHQKKIGKKGIINYWDPQQKCFRLIFSAPMRVPPKLTVLFDTPELEAVPLEPVTRNTATAELRFKARSPGGFLTEPAPILQIELNAEL